MPEREMKHRGEESDACGDENGAEMKQRGEMKKERSRYFCFGVIFFKKKGDEEGSGVILKMGVNK